ncbi:hypothetical protein CROQUDRAFT_651569 [Cronartium quercuum f. sp. fusiforme G11]|uniref:Dolichyl-phosphate-mannose--protein mannosyltransferase n=1 Tax=Cronartium quercuum f. sp. fusiforme G11 TaxID=708437 RepID=A0A9P6NPR2_9BASI|nr:hypothetical protein CROQUDRAFT_651569 [Cronartium quercuum f. sp. fusiforme G11]
MAQDPLRARRPLHFAGNPSISPEPAQPVPSPYPHSQTSSVASSPDTARASPYIYPPPWATSSGPDRPPIHSSAYFKTDPASSSNYAEGWLMPEGSSRKLYAKGKRPPTSGGFWTRLGGGLHLLETEGTREGWLLVLLTGLAIVVRCWAIWRPSSVVFDEVHFGGFTSKYIKSAFFMDVHPPLAKLLITLVAFLSGYQGNFNFRDIGSDYITGNVPYVQMRLLPALMGVLVVPLSYLTMRMLTLRPTSCLLGALLIMFENGMIVQSRFILLDSPVLFFTTLTIFFHTGFCNEDARRGFTRRWWIWLLLTGLSLGAVASSKWVGLFTIATVGLVTIKQLWDLLADLRVPIPLLARSFIGRAIALILIPVWFYMFIFQIHFWVLSGSGEGDAFMSSEFQHTLRGHWMPDTFADVLVGSNVTIRHINTQGGYLHSHPQPYPTGSRQQQVTLYPHSDTNNLWTILGRLADDTDVQHRPPKGYYNREKIFVNHTSFIRLEHAETNKKLHSHDVRPPVTEVDYQNEVSAYGFPGFPGDANDEWIVEIVSKHSELVTDPISGTRLRALRTKFRLRHPLQNCYLFSHRVKLPDWGFEQQEVSCNKNPTLANSLWYIESSTHPLLQMDRKAEKVNYRRPSFVEKFLELQKVMWQTNKALVDRHAYDSRPSSWPVLRRGINFWVKDHRQVYLLGNPFIWWLSSAAVGVFGVMKVLLILRQKRGYRADLNNANISKYNGIGCYLTLGWATHYFPFFLMNRQLFLHHYFPALYYAILLTSSIFDLATAKSRTKTRLKALSLIVLVAVWSWWVFAPITYAGLWTRTECERARWLRTWDFSCHEFFESRQQYYPGGHLRFETSVPYDLASPSATSIAPEPIPNVFEEVAKGAVGGELSSVVGEEKQEKN